LALDRHWLSILRQAVPTGGVDVTDLDAAGPCVRVRAPAKINLFLAVRGRRADGFHDLVTVFQTLSLFDEIRAGSTGLAGRGHVPAGRRHMTVELLTDGDPGLPPAAQNLAVRAARVLGERAGLVDTQDEGADGPATTLELRKGIPIAGGMAGGSVDAAAALLALNQLWECRLETDDLRLLAAELGSDVPFCVVGGTALATGRGTSMAQVLCPGRFTWVVCTSDEPLLTADVYRSWDRHCRPSDRQPDAVLHALRAGDAVALGSLLHNDLEPAAFALRPELAEQKDELLAAGALGAVLSGSGPTLLALCADEASALEIADAVLGAHPQVLVARSPAGGPELSSC